MLSPSRGTPTVSENGAPSGESPGTVPHKAKLRIIFDSVGDLNNLVESGSAFWGNGRGVKLQTWPPACPYTRWRSSNTEHDLGLFHPYLSSDLHRKGETMLGPVCAALAIMLAISLAQGSPIARLSTVTSRSSPTRIERGLTGCACSPSRRGFASSHNFTSALRDYVEVLHEEERPSTMPLLSELYFKVRRLFAQCAAERGLEACVNIDAALRADCRFTVTMCTFDRTSGINLNHVPDEQVFEQVPACDERAQFRSPDARLGRLPNPPLFANPPSSRHRGDHIAAGGGHFATYSCDGAAPLPRSNTQKIFDWSPHSFEEEPLIAGAVYDATADPEPSTMPARDMKVSEGCVAVEHLQGLPLFHRHSLRRPVLCHAGFCATPHHAIVVRGETTSMGRLCKRRWKCTEETKLVNNINVFERTSAIVKGGIEITPYDVRFPPALTWVAQGFMALFWLR